MHRLALLSTLVAWSAALPAQVSLRGHLTDSLTTRAFSGARVQLVSVRAPWGEGRVTASDTLGRYQFDGVPAGTYTLGFDHPRLDSLGMDAVLRTITIDEGADSITADVALPGARALANALCGPRGDTTGVIIGRARDARVGIPRRGARVAATWGELVMDTRTMRSTSADVWTITSTDGRYVLCGVPTDVAVLLQVRAADSVVTDSSMAIEVAFAPDTPLLHRDLWLADSTTGITRVTGRVLRPDGVPLAGARVRIRGMQQITPVVTDSSGAFTLAGVSGGTQTLEAIAIGYTPTKIPVDVRTNADQRVSITMRAPVTTLEAVTVRAIMSRDTREYLARAQTTGLGFFMSGDAVRSRGVALLSFALLSAPGIRVQDTQFGRPVLSGPFRCQPRYFLDGWEIQGDELDRFASVATLGGIEVYRQPSEVPPQLMRGLLIPRDVSAQCHMVFVWSKSVVDPG